MKQSLLFIVAASALFACNRLKRKGQGAVHKTREVVANAKQRITDKKDEVVDKVFPAYDSYQPDTKNNKRRFKEHLQVDPTDSVLNIYTYGDFMGIDYTVLIAFTCNQATVDSIVTVKKMQPIAVTNEGLVTSTQLTWWKKDGQRFSQAYRAGEDAVWWEYLWYDAESKQAYYEEFSL